MPLSRQASITALRHKLTSRGNSRDDGTRSFVSCDSYACSETRSRVSENGGSTVFAPSAALSQDDGKLDYDSFSEGHDDYDGVDGAHHHHHLFVGREDELEKLNTIYARLCQRSLKARDASAQPNNKNKEAQIVLVAGHSGTGKSTLIQKFLEPIRMENFSTNGRSSPATIKPCHLCHGKYDQFSNTMALGGIIDAFSGFFNQLESDLPEERERIASEIRKRLDKERTQLVCSVVPGLQAMLESDAPTKLHDDDVDDNDNDAFNNRSMVFTTAIAPPPPSRPEAADAAASVVSNTSSRRSRKSRNKEEVDNLQIPESRDARWPQLLYSFKVILRVVCSLDRPLILYLDDIQWIDRSSQNLIAELLLDTSIQNFLFLGSYRDNEVEDKPQHPFRLAKEQWMKSKRKLHEIALENFSQSQIEDYLRKMLMRDDTKELANVLYQKTHGNILHTTQAVAELQRRKILYKNPQWTWDIARVSQEIELASNVVDLIVMKLKSMPKHVQYCLTVASFLRSNFNQAVLEMLVEETSISNATNWYSMDYTMGVDEVLKIAVDERLLEKNVRQKASTTTSNNGSANAGSGGVVQLDFANKTTTYGFAHDRIQQAAMSLVPSDDDLQKLRYCIGHILMRLADHPFLGENWMWFVAADQFEGVSTMSSIENIISPLELIRLNLMVGLMAIKVSAFVPASQYLHRAKHDLESKVHDAWNVETELCLEVHRELAQVELCLGNYEQGRKLSDELLAHSNSIQERIIVNSSLGMALGREGKYAEGLKLTLNTLFVLKTFPRRNHMLHVLRESRMVSKCVEKFSDEEILQLPPMTNKKYLYTMHALRYVMPLSFFSNQLPTLFLAIVRQIRLTFKYGLTGEGVNAFANYAALLMNVFKKKALGLRMCSLAINMLDQIESKHVDSQALSVIFSFIKSWSDPVHKLLPVLQRGHRSGLQSGDLESGYRNWAVSLMLAFTTGVPLSEIRRVSLNCLAQLKHYRVNSVCDCYQYIHLTIDHLIGTNEEEIDWNTIADIPAPRNMTHTDKMQWMFYCWGYIQIALHFGKIDVAKSLVKPFKFTGKDDFSFLIEATKHYTCTLALLQYAKKTKKQKYVRMAKQGVRDLKAAFELKGAASIHRYMLLEADVKAATPKSDTQLVREAYDKAIAGAARSGHIQDCAYGNELAAEYFMSQASTSSRKSSRLSRYNFSAMESETFMDNNYDSSKTVDDYNFWAVRYLSNALSLYKEWGAHAKVKYLREKHSKYLGAADEANDGEGRRKHSSQRHSTATRACLAAAHQMYSSVDLQGV
eukprot:CAMPEP_0119551578 /NCGR_PEP_ID=MMETSP1352-20130426/4781_1 /TAXON_ID=265584 /ORGANISM="Stauroneis constricta, Strain CCMP1120" /LENGTH=1288 /DNA_ID=CAMNT_0007597655 /DNA_START=20 /DNA_END=3886 /DNA_ORIENTATION=+